MINSARSTRIERTALPQFVPAQQPATFALVIPTLNEEGNIGRLLPQVRSILDPLGISYEVIVVDDDSRDGTADVVNAIAANDPRVRLLVRKGERGLSGAILYGWRATAATFVGVMDADFQHPPEVLPKLVSAMQAGRDIAIGSRYTQGGELGDWNPVRKLLSAAAVWATLPIQQRGVCAHDPMSGYFFVRRGAIVGIDFQPTGFKLLLEVLVRAKLASLEEVPFVFGLRNRGDSKANLKVGLDYAKLLARLYASRLGLLR
jgi:dolichol-phosphate mannosyltransferase